MVASVGIAAKGASLTWNNYHVAELTNISGPGSTAETLDITNHDSPNSYREFVMGVIEGGTFDIEGNFVSTDTNGQVALITDHYSRTARAAKINFIQSSFEFTATVTQFNVTSPAAGILAFKATLKVSGKPTVYTTLADGLTTPFFALRDNGANAITPSPVAAGTVYEYAATLDAADTAIAIQPTAAAGTIYVNGTLTTTGNWTSDITVAAGTTKLLVVEAREASKASKFYRIFVTRPSS